jgi:hypothetical protein
MNGRIPVRGAGRPSRLGPRRGPRRAPRRIDAARVLAFLLMVASGAAIYQLTRADAFEIVTTQVSGAVLVAGPDLDAALDLGADPPNAFSLHTDALRERLAALPGVERADVSVSLPGTVVVHLVERKPVMAWRVGSSILLVDRDGNVISDAAADGTGGDAERVAAGLPAVVDHRFDAVLAAASPTPAPSASPRPTGAKASSRPAATPNPKAKASPTPRPRATPAASPDPSAVFGPADATPSPAESDDPTVVDPAANSALGATAVPRPGDVIDALDFDIATRLLSLVPADVGTAAESLQVVIDADVGWTVRPTAGSWVAVFGLYSRELRGPALIPDQVRLLRSVLSDAGETHVGRILLADANSGTYLRH